MPDVLATMCQPGNPIIRETRRRGVRRGRSLLPTPRQDFRNRLLASLKPEDQALIAEYLEPRPLRFRQRIEPANRKIRNIYFIEEGLASVIAISASGRRQAEVGMIGYEGVSGVAAILGAQRSPHETYMQVAGRGLCITADRLLSLMSASTSLAETLHRYAHVFAVQTAHATLANALGTVEERLARWLLIAHDRLRHGDIRLTHENLALMIGVRRPGITVGLQRLEDLRLVSAGRGIISILDRPGLENYAKGLYGVPEAEFARLFG